MLDKEKAKKAGYTVMESTNKLPEEKKKKLEQLRAILPELVNADGLLNTSALKDFFGMENIASANQGYSLNFAGKGLAKIKADEPTEKELKVELKQSKNFDKTENVIIRGDNLDVLKLLRQNYTSKIKMIYIDPPYNTGNANFVYEDNFRESEAELIEKYDIDEDAINFFENVLGSKTHSNWIFAMYPRLKLARDLLTDDGVIFISIDDNEQANLKIMCDEIFGGGNFVAQITRKTKLTSNKGTFFAPSHEYVLCYAKNIYNLGMFNDPEAQEDEKYQKLFKYEDAYSRYNIVGLYQPSLDTRPNQRYYVKCPDGSFVIPPGNSFPDEIKDGSFVKPYDHNDKVWRWSYDSYLKYEKSQLVFLKTKTSPLLNERRKQAIWNVYTKIYLKDRIKDGLRPTTFITKYPNSEASKELIKMDIPFNFSKPKNIVKYLAKIIQSNNNSIVLDFFAGSGTTAHAVMDLNKADGGNRKFILVQWDEKIDPKTSKPAYDFCTENNLEPVISSICIERVNRAGKKIKAEAGKDGNDTDIGYKVFSLIDRPKLSENDNGQLTLNINRATTKDTLYNMILASGEAIFTSPVEEIEKDMVYKVSNSIFVLGECTSDLEQYASSLIYIDGYANISLEKWFNMQGLNTETVKILY